MSELGRKAETTWWRARAFAVPLQTSGRLVDHSLVPGERSFNQVIPRHFRKPDSDGDVGVHVERNSILVESHELRYPD